jgi:hypothetical protein
VAMPAMWIFMGGVVMGGVGQVRGPAA